MSTFTLPQRRTMSIFAPGAALFGMYRGYQDKDKKDPSFKELTTDSLWQLPVWFTTNVLLMAKSGVKLTPRMLGSNLGASAMLSPVLMGTHMSGYYAGKKFSDLFGKKTYDRK